MKSYRSLALVLVSLTAACGGDDGDDTDNGTCTAAKTYTAAIAATNGSATNTGAGFDEAAIMAGTSHIIYAGGTLNEDATPDFLEIDLWAGFGAFDGSDVTAKTIAIAGDETNFYTCGVCVQLSTDLVNDANGDPQSAADYWATGGSVTLSSVSGMLTGSFSDVKVEHAEFDDDAATTTPVGDCSSTVSGTFSIPVEAAFAGTKEPGKRTHGAPRVRIPLAQL